MKKSIPSIEMLNKLVKLNTNYLHIKSNKIYNILNYGFCVNRQKPVVIYKSIENSNNNIYFVRDIDDFTINEKFKKLNK